MPLIRSLAVDICHAMQCTQATATAMHSGDSERKGVQTSTELDIFYYIYTHYIKRRYSKVPQVSRAICDVPSEFAA